MILDLNQIARLDYREPGLPLPYLETHGHHVDMPAFVYFYHHRASGTVKRILCMDYDGYYVLFNRERVRFSYAVAEMIDARMVLDRAE